MAATKQAKSGDSWFAVDKEGLAQLVADRKKWFVITELLQNAWDQNVTNVSLLLWSVGRNVWNLVVEDDDPNGFLDLSHAFTLYAPSNKKGDPTKRGFFNLGEKLVLSLCRYAKLETTSGTVIFDDEVRRVERSRKREVGSRLTLTIRLTKAEAAEALSVVDMLIPPEGKTTTVNDKVLRRPEPIVTFETSLPTRISNSDGNMSRTVRKTTVSVYKPVGRPGYLFEMGIPVVETGDMFDVDVGQKVLLNSERDNVTPAYLARIRSEVFNHTYNLITTPEDANASWVREAASSPDCKPEGLERVLDLRFGEKRVGADPSDRQAENAAFSQGYSVIHGRNLSAGEWNNIKTNNLLQPAGKVFPTNPGNKVTCPPVPTHLWPAHFVNMARYWNWAARQLMKQEMDIMVVQGPDSVSTVAQYFKEKDSGYRRTTWNIGHPSFPRIPETFGKADIPQFLVPWNDLLIHEYGHEYTDNHLSADYYHALTQLGAKLTMLGMTQGDKICSFFLS